jgi:hypothetical protein
MSAVLTLQLLHEADSFLDTEKQHQDATNLGEKLFQAFSRGDKEKEGKISSQVRNLQQVAMSATRFADVEDFVKNQMGKEKLDDNGRPKAWRQTGDAILQQLKTLRDQADKLATDEGQRLLLRLHLVRGWVRAVVCAYLYEKAHKEMTKNHA